MISLRKRSVFCVVATAVFCLLLTGNYYWKRSDRLHQLSMECPEAEQAKDWKVLEARSLEWLKTEPDSAYARFWLGEALHNQGRFQESLKLFQEIDVLGPRGIDAAINAMHIQFFVNHLPSAAMETAAHLLAVDPSLAEPIRVRVYFYAMTFQRGKLLEEIKTAIKYRADLPEHFVHLMLLEDLSFRDGADVVGRWLAHDKQMTEILTDSLFVHSILSQREAAVNDTESDGKVSLTAIREMCRDKVLSRESSVIVLELAIRLELEAGNYQLVESLLERVPETSANDPVLWLHRGKFSLDKDDIEDAETSLERAIELFPTGWKARGYLATVKRLRGAMVDSEKLQEISGEGAGIVGDCIRLKTNRDVPKSLLLRISNYAKSCEAGEIAAAIARRVM